jgi:hypothetical protein
MTDTTLQLEARAILAQRHREARAALRVREAKSGPPSVAVGFAGRLARPGIRMNRTSPRFWPSGGLRGPPVNE